jgi:hypothetical protein
VTGATFNLRFCAFGPTVAEAPFTRRIPFIAFPFFPKAKGLYAPHAGRCQRAIGPEIRSLRRCIRFPARRAA